MSLPVPGFPRRCLLAMLALAACPAAMANDRASVVVIRGGELGSWSPSKSSSVIVMRPASGSFLRETTRLAAEADAREERLARQRERDTDVRIAEALGALQATAYAAANSTRADNWWPVFLPHDSNRLPPPSRPRAPAALSMPDR